MQVGKTSWTDRDIKVNDVVCGDLNRMQNYRTKIQCFFVDVQLVGHLEEHWRIREGEGKSWILPPPPAYLHLLQY